MCVSFCGVSCVGRGTKNISGNRSGSVNKCLCYCGVKSGSEKWEVARDAATKVTGDLKVGSKVTIEYTMTAKKIEAKEAKKAEAKKAEPKKK
jgi:hypothetical protein